MTTILDTGLGAESSYNGFMFSIKALQDVEVQALYAESQSPLSIDVTIYSASGAWEACKSRFAAWEHVGNGSFTKVRGALNEPCLISRSVFTLKSRSVTRLGLAQPVCIKSNSVHSFYIHTADTAGVGFNSGNGLVTACE